MDYSFPTVDKKYLKGRNLGGLDCVHVFMDILFILPKHDCC